LATTREHIPETLPTVEEFKEALGWGTLDKPVGCPPVPPKKDGTSKVPAPNAHQIKVRREHPNSAMLPVDVFHELPDLLGIGEAPLREDVNQGLLATYARNGTVMAIWDDVYAHQRGLIAIQTETLEEKNHKESAKQQNRQKLIEARGQNVKTQE